MGVASETADVDAEAGAIAEVGADAEAGAIAEVGADAEAGAIAEVRADADDADTNAVVDADTDQENDGPGDNDCLGVIGKVESKVERRKCVRRCFNSMLAQTCL